MAWRKLIYEDSDPIAFTGDVGVEGAGKTFTALQFNVTPSTELVIATGDITRTQTWHRVDGEGDAADQLDGIAGGADGMFLILMAEDGGTKPITVAHNQNVAAVNNILLANGDNYLMDGDDKYIMFIFDVLVDTNGAWVELTRATGAAAVMTSTAPVNTDHGAAVVGTSGEAAQQDHKHDVDEGVAGTLAPVDGTAEALGTDAAIPHLDHIHQLGPLVANLDFDGSQALSLVLEAVATAPDAAAETEGQIYFDTTGGDKHVYVWNT